MQRPSQTGTNSSGGGGDHRPGRGRGYGHGHGHGFAKGAAPPFKLLTRVNPNDGDGTGSGGPGNGNIGGSTNNNSSGGRGASMGLGSPQLPNSNLPPTASLPPQAPMYNAYSPMYGYNVQSPPMQASPLPSPSGGVGAVPQQRSRMQPIAPPSYMVPSQGPRGESGRMNQSSPGVSQSTPPNSGGRGGRRERSGSLMSHSGIYSASEQNLPEQQQQQQQPTHSAHDVVMAEHSEPDTKEPKEGKPRQEKRERSRRDRAIRQAQQLQQQDDASNSGKPPRLIMDPNSFQRQTLVQITGSAGNSLSNGGGGVGPSNSRGTGELFDDDYSRGMPQQQQQQQQQSSSVGETSSRSGNRRPPPPAGRAVYSWTGSSSSSSSPAMLSSNQPPQLPQQQQQHLSSLQQQQQQLPHQDQQHRQQLIQHMQQQQQLTPGYNPSHIRGATGPFSQPGHRDARSMGAPQTSVSVGGPHSAGGGRSILQQQGAVPLVAVPPPMRSHSTKLVNDCWKFVDGAEQWLSDHPGHFVVGVLGGQGVGKSTLLSSFCQNSTTSSAPVFAKQPPQMASVGGFQTSGIDLYVTPTERMILLDTEPIYCLSNLEMALRNERITDGVPVELWLDHQALLQAAFLVSVCNVVIVVVEGMDTRMLKLLRRVELFMKALSASSGSGLVTGVAAGGGSVSGNSAGAVGPPGLNPLTGDGSLHGLGDWCADIVLVSTKVPAMSFGVDYYKERSEELTIALQHSALQLFGSINMTAMHSRFEQAFKQPSQGSGPSPQHTDAEKQQQQRQPEPPTNTKLSSEHDNAAEQTPSLSNQPDAKQRQALQGSVPSVSSPQHQQPPLSTQSGQKQASDDRKSAKHLNYVTLPFDSQLGFSPTAMGSGSSTSSSSSATPGKAADRSGVSTSSKAHDGSQLMTSTLQSLTMMLHTHVAANSPLNRHDVLGSGNTGGMMTTQGQGRWRNPDHDVLARLVQDQERWRTWAKTLRNKILSLSMRPQGGPALGPRNRPGMVSEREWLRYATRTLDVLKKADFLSEFVQASKVSRE